MKTILVDDEEKAMKIFEMYAREMPEIQVVGEFSMGESALKYARDNKVDLAVLDIEMCGINGIHLGRMLKNINPDILLIYITGYEDYAMDAIRLHAAAYLLKPYTKEQLYYEIETAKLLSRRKKNRIYIKTFGHFDIFVDDKPIMFHSEKSKELLALLVDRQGGTINTDQIICALWENRPNDEYTQNLCSKVSKRLYNELKEYGAENILIFERGVKRIEPDNFGCDLYEMLAGNQNAINQFVGDYMLDYSWAELKMEKLSKYLNF